MENISPQFAQTLKDLRKDILLAITDQSQEYIALQAQV